MSIIGSNILAGASGQATGYNLTNSLRFRQSANGYLSRTPSSATNRKTWTWSGWVKLGTLGTDRLLFSAGTGATDSVIYFDSTNKIRFNTNNSSNIVTTQVFRDPSAWYHIVGVLDTTQATAADRVKLYINGTLTNTATSAPTQNTDGGINNNIQHLVGGYASSPSVISYDGYMTEVNFVDGTALTPSSFGETSATTGQWIPKKYTSTYGTNGFYLPFKLNNTSSFQANYTTSSQYLSVASNAAFGYGTGDFTVEGWHYATASGTSYLFDQRTTGTQVAPAMYISGGSYIVYINGAVALTAGTVVTNQWVHWALVRASGTTKLYINGISVGSFADSNSYITSPFIIGNVWIGGGPYGWAGYLSNVRAVKGTAVYTANFTPSSTPLTAISGTSLLTLQNTTIVDNSTNAFTITNSGTITTSTATPFVANIFGDNSGNNNTWAGNNINYSTAGVTYDAMLDVPTNTSATVANYAIVNPLDIPGTPTIADANLKLTGGASAWGASRTGFAMTSGKWYWEVTILSANTALNGIDLGIANSNAITPGIGTTNTWVYNNNVVNGRKSLNGTVSAYGVTYVANDIVGIAFDADAGSITFYVNNSSQGVMASTGLPNPAFPYTEAYGSDSVAVNFGQRPFTYTAPSGFVALNTYNLPTPTILQGNKYMDATLYTGTGASLAITNAGAFKPDMVWIGPRSTGNDKGITDSVRGVTKQLYTDLSNTEYTDSTFITSLNSNGFTAGTSGGLNASAVTYVGWQWQANQGSTVSNTSGSITSTVSVNTTAGFSVVTYTGTGSVATVGHGLGVAPKWIVVKGRTNVDNWPVYQASANASPATGHLLLNTTAAFTSTSSTWNNTAPTSTVFTIGTDTRINQNTITYVAYCWAEIAGFSKFGSYTGNNSLDGPFVYLGFRPKFIMFKDSSQVSVWSIMDSARETYNVQSIALAPNNSFAESTYTGYAQADFLSNGFKIRANNANQYWNNVSGNTYIYMAFAESPLKFSNAR